MKKVVKGLLIGTMALALAAAFVPVAGNRTRSGQRNPGRGQRHPRSTSYDIQRRQAFLNAAAAGRRCRAAQPMK